MIASKDEREQESEQGSRTAERRSETKERATTGEKGEERERERERQRRRERLDQRKDKRRNVQQKRQRMLKRERELKRQESQSHPPCCEARTLSRVKEKHYTVLDNKLETRFLVPAQAILRIGDMHGANARHKRCRCARAKLRTERYLIDFWKCWHQHLQGVSAVCGRGFRGVSKGFPRGFLRTAAFDATRTPKQCRLCT